VVLSIRFYQKVGGPFYSPEAKGPYPFLQHHTGLYAWQGPGRYVEDMCGRCGTVIQWWSCWEWMRGRWMMLCEHDHEFWTMLEDLMA